MLAILEVIEKGEKASSLQMFSEPGMTAPWTLDSQHRKLRPSQHLIELYNCIFVKMKGIQTLHVLALEF